MNKKSFYLAMIVVSLALMVWSGIDPINRKTWAYEIIPAVLLMMVLIFTHRRFPFTPLPYVFAFVAILVMAIGAHYTYGREPFLHFVQEWWNLSRNNFDRVGHFVQGMIPVFFFREIMIRNNVLKRSWLWFVLLCISVAISAVYELFELYYAMLFSKENIDAFLGAQGDRWDSHWDIFSALLGAVFVLLVFSKWHDRLIENQAYR